MPHDKHCRQKKVALSKALKCLAAYCVMGSVGAATPFLTAPPWLSHCASGAGRKFQSLGRPRRRARRSPVPPLDQL